MAQASPTSESGTTRIRDRVRFATRPSAVVSADGATALLSFTATATPMTPLRIDTADSRPPVPLLPIDQVVTSDLVKPELHEIEFV